MSGVCCSVNDEEVAKSFTQSHFDLLFCGVDGLEFLSCDVCAGKSVVWDGGEFHDFPGFVFEHLEVCNDAHLCFVFVLDGVESGVEAFLVLDGNFSASGCSVLSGGDVFLHNLCVQFLHPFEVLDVSWEVFLALVVVVEGCCADFFDTFSGVADVLLFADGVFFAVFGDFPFVVEKFVYASHGDSPFSVFFPMLSSVREVNEAVSLELGEH